MEKDKTKAKLILLLRKELRYIVQEELALLERRLYKNLALVLEGANKQNIREEEDSGLQIARSMQQQKTSNVRNRVHNEFPLPKKEYAKDPMLNEMLNSVQPMDEGEYDEELFVPQVDTSNPAVKEAVEAQTRDYSKFLKAMDQKFGKV